MVEFGFLFFFTGLAVASLCICWFVRGAAALRPYFPSHYIGFICCCSTSESQRRGFVVSRKRKSWNIPWLGIAFGELDAERDLHSRWLSGDEGNRTSTSYPA